MLFSRLIILATTLTLPLAALSQSDSSSQSGVEVGRPSALRNFIPAEKLERHSSQQYDQLIHQAQSKRALAPANHPQVKRLRAIADKIIPFAPRFNPRAKEWRWEVNLIGSKQINAYCMPGGKIAFFSGILDTLKLTDDELAVVMGHEVAHALQEHARERIAKGELTQIGASVLGQLIGKGRYSDAFHVGGNLLTLKFSRDDESEADLVGLDLAARAGFDPRAGITLWKKMAAASKGARPQWLSTHPSGPSRIKDIERALPRVMPIYAKATEREVSALPTHSVPD